MSTKHDFWKNTILAGVASPIEIKAKQRRENMAIIFKYVPGYSQGKE